MSIDSPQIQAIKERYRSSFPEKIATLTELRTNLELSENPADELTLAKDELHKLAGSAGMYGYDDLSLKCREGMKNADEGDSTGLKKTLSSVIGMLEAHSNV